ncbi:MAG: glycosyltransferase family 1 protein, partial [Patescibacteria group bacterium]
HEYLASGYPVVVTDLPAYTPFSDVCYISKDYNEFSQNIRKGLEEDSDPMVKKRQKVASQNTWDQKVAKMLSLINNL